jgi:hypothetical protein
MYDSLSGDLQVNIGEGDAYEGIPISYLYIPNPGFNPDGFHRLRLEVLGDDATATLDGTYSISMTRVLPMDAASAGLIANVELDASFDNFSLTAEPDNRRTIFKDVDLVTTDPDMDEVFPSWSRDGKKLAPYKIPKIFQFVDAILLTSV